MSFLVTRKTAAQLPNDFNHTVNFDELSANAIKAFLYVTAKFEKEQHSAVSFTWADLDSYLSNRASTGVGTMSGSEYMRCRAALNGALHTIVTFMSGASETHAYTLFSGWKLNSTTREILVWLNPRFKRILENIGANFYTLVYLEEAKKLDDPRHLRMLMWCYEFLNFHDPVYRRLGVMEVKKALNLNTALYDDWRRVGDKLRDYTAVINQRTDIHLKLTPIKEGRTVVAVQFDVAARKRLNLKKGTKK